MQGMNSRAMPNADLNLFAVFEALERERSVTRAAETLGLSQPAVSHALNRLRDLYGDRLFVRSPGGMQPTPRAAELAAPVREAVAALQSTLAPRRFEPATSRDVFRLAMDNVATIVLAAKLASRVAGEAPDARCVVTPSGTLDVELLLKRGSIGLAVGLAPDLAPGDQRHLLEDRYVAVMNRSEADASASLGLGRFAAGEHIRISSFADGTGFVDLELGRRGLSRTVRLEVPYIAAGVVLERSGAIGVVPLGIALELGRTHGIAWRDLPIPSPPVTIGMRWSPLHERTPAHRWLRATLRSLAAPRDAD